MFLNFAFFAAENIFSLRLRTLIFVSHDREFVSSLATRIIELTPTGIVDFHGTYEDYLRSQDMGNKFATG